MGTPISYKQFCNNSFARGADYIQPQYDGIKGSGRVLICATAVVQRFPKVVGVWIKGKGVVWTDNIEYCSFPNNLK